MKLYTTDTNKMIEITLRNWDEAGHQWSPDCFDDLEVNFTESRSVLDGDLAYICTQQEVDDLLTWWEDEVAKANEDPEYAGDGLCACGKEWSLDVEVTED